MKNIFRNITLAAVLVGSMLFGATQLVSPVSADTKSDVRGGVTSIGGGDAGNTAADFNALIKSIINILLFIIGVIAVIMIIIGGIRYTTSNGDASQTKSAKDTILYSIVGLIIAIMSYSIVNFVIGKL